MNTADPVPTVILGAAGRDFHNFNVVYRDDPQSRVVAFTAAQIPGIADRRYPASLAGPSYPAGIPIEEEGDLEEICRHHAVRRVVFAYSVVSHEQMMHLASRALAAGADFALLGPESTMLRSARPVIAVTAVRTGCGKSQVARYVAHVLRGLGWRVAVVRHPMPYGDLDAMRVQRFASMEDVDRAACTAEEREEYEPHIVSGSAVFAGVDYAAVLAAAEAEADVIVWDGGNNDFPFFRPDLHLVVMDALRPGHAQRYHPGEAVLRMADVVVVNKADAATPEQLRLVRAEAAAVAPVADLLVGHSPTAIAGSPDLRGRRVLVVEDGPTITHGGMPHGAGFRAALAAGAMVVDPRSSAPQRLAKVFARYPHIGPVLPALGYDRDELEDLASTIDGSAADLVLAATPVDLGRLITVSKPIVRVRYEYEDAPGHDHARRIRAFIQDRQQ